MPKVKKMNAADVSGIVLALSSVEFGQQRDFFNKLGNHTLTLAPTFSPLQLSRCIYGFGLARVDDRRVYDSLLAQCEDKQLLLYGRNVVDILCGLAEAGYFPAKHVPWLLERASTNIEKLKGEDTISLLHILSRLPKNPNVRPTARAGGNRKIPASARAAGGVEPLSGGEMACFSWRDGAEGSSHFFNGFFAEEDRETALEKRRKEISVGKIIEGRKERMIDADRGGNLKSSKLKSSGYGSDSSEFPTTYLDPEHESQIDADSKFSDEEGGVLNVSQLEVFNTSKLVEACLENMRRRSWNVWRKDPQDVTDLLEAMQLLKGSTSDNCMIDEFLLEIVLRPMHLILEKASLEQFLRLISVLAHLPFRGREIVRTHLHRDGRLQQQIDFKLDELLNRMKIDVRSSIMLFYTLTKLGEGE
jgi:hypothetical protein